MIKTRQMIFITMKSKTELLPSKRTRQCTPVRNKRYTLALSPSARRRIASNVLPEFLGLVDNFDFEIKPLYVDSEFYDGKCVTLKKAHNNAYLVPVIACGNKMQQELWEELSCEIDHELTMEFDAPLVTVEFPVIIGSTCEIGALR
jgi:hypothetical protein